MIEWILGVFAAFLAILGLVLASGAWDTGMFTFGLALFAFGVLFDFWLIKKHFDAVDRAGSAD